MVNRLNSSLSETSDSGIVLKLLSAVWENNSSLTQRSLAKELGIALGLANAYVKRYQKRGLLKFSRFLQIDMLTILRPTGSLKKVV